MNNVTVEPAKAEVRVFAKSVTPLEKFKDYLDTDMKKDDSFYVQRLAAEKMWIRKDFAKKDDPNMVKAKREEMARLEKELRVKTASLIGSIKAQPEEMKKLFGFIKGLAGDEEQAYNVYRENSVVRPGTYKDVASNAYDRFCVLGNIVGISRQELKAAGVNYLPTLTEKEQRAQGGRQNFVYPALK